MQLRRRSSESRRKEVASSRPWNRNTCAVQPQHRAGCHGYWFRVETAQRFSKDSGYTSSLLKPITQTLHFQYLAIAALSRCLVLHENAQVRFLLKVGKARRRAKTIGSVADLHSLRRTIFSRTTGLFHQNAATGCLVQLEQLPQGKKEKGKWLLDFTSKEFLAV